MTKLSKEDIEKARFMRKIPGMCMQDIASEFKVTKRAIRYHLQHYISDEETINYEKQATCVPEQFYFHCHSCKISFSEKQPDKIIEHVKRHQEAHPIKNLIEVAL